MVVEWNASSRSVSAPLLRRLGMIAALAFLLTAAPAAPDGSLAVAIADDGGDGDGGDGDGGDGDGGDGDGGDGDGGDGDDGGGDDGGGDDGGGDDGGDDGDDGGGRGFGGLGGIGGGSAARPSGRQGNILNRLLSRTPFRARTRSSRGGGSPGDSRSAATDASRPLPGFAQSEVVALDLADAQIAQLVSQGYRVLEQADLSVTASRLVRLQVPTGTSLEDARTAIAAVQGTAAADFNHFYRPGTSRPDTHQPDTHQPDTHQPDTGPACDELWCKAPNLIKWPVGETTVEQCTIDSDIGLIDTGINTEHEALKDSRIEVIRTAPDANARSGAQHGTAVAVLLVGSTKTRAQGLLRDARLIAVDAFHQAGANDERTDVFTLVRSLDLLADRDVSIINLSLSGPANRLLETMVRTLRARGIHLVAASGNGGPGADPAYPAAYPGVIAVTAIDSGKRVYRRAGQGAHIDFSAPGVNVWTAASIRGARTKTGTSFATPFVTAVAATAIDRAPGEPPSYEALKAALAAVSEDLGAEGHDPVYGHGLIQMPSDCG